MQDEQHPDQGGTNGMVFRRFGILGRAFGLWHAANASLPVVTASAARPAVARVPGESVPLRSTGPDRSGNGNRTLGPENTVVILQVDGTPGAEQRGVAGVGVVVRAMNGRVLTWHCRQVPAQTCNEAEYQALIVGLEVIARQQPTTVWCVSDSRVVMDQMTGRCNVHAGPLQPLHAQAMALARQLPRIRYIAIPRAWNRLADALAWEALGGRQQLMQGVIRQEQPVRE